MPTEPKKKKKGKNKAETSLAAPAETPTEAPAGSPAVEKTSLESSVRLSKDVYEQYEEMAEENKSQKTDVFSHVVQRFTEEVIAHPKRFRGELRPWTQKADDQGADAPAT